MAEMFIILNDYMHSSNNFEFSYLESLQNALYVIVLNYNSGRAAVV